MKRLLAPMNLAVYLVSEWMWLPLKDKLTHWDVRLEEAKRRNRFRY